MKSGRDGNFLHARKSPVPCGGALALRRMQTRNCSMRARRYFRRFALAEFFAKRHCARGLRKRRPAQTRFAGAIIRRALSR